MARKAAGGDDGDQIAELDRARQRKQLKLFAQKQQADETRIRISGAVSAVFEGNEDDLKFGDEIRMELVTVVKQAVTTQHDSGRIVREIVVVVEDNKVILPD